MAASIAAAGVRACGGTAAGAGAGGASAAGVSRGISGTPPKPAAPAPRPTNAHPHVQSSVNASSCWASCVSSRCMLALSRGERIVERLRSRQRARLLGLSQGTRRSTASRARAATGGCAPPPSRDCDNSAEGGAPSVDSPASPRSTAPCAATLAHQLLLLGGDCSSPALHLPLRFLTCAAPASVPSPISTIDVRVALAPISPRGSRSVRRSARRQRQQQATPPEARSAQRVRRRNLDAPRTHA